MPDGNGQPFPIQEHEIGALVPTHVRLQSIVQVFCFGKR